MFARLHRPLQPLVEHRQPPFEQEFQVEVAPHAALLVERNIAMLGSMPSHNIERLAERPHGHHRRLTPVSRLRPPHTLIDQGDRHRAPLAINPDLVNLRHHEDGRDHSQHEPERSGVHDLPEQPETENMKPHRYSPFLVLFVPRASCSVFVLALVLVLVIVIVIVIASIARKKNGLYFRACASAPSARSPSASINRPSWRACSGASPGHLRGSIGGPR